MSIKIQENISLQDFNTFKIDCVARYFCIVKSVEDFKKCLDFILEKNLNYLILGSGSNILFKNNYYDGLIIKNEINFLEIEEENERGEVFLKVGSGYEWDSFVKYCCENNYCGIENLSHIPGTVGAAPVQNIGAYGVEVKDVISSVEYIDISKYLNNKENTTHLNNLENTRKDKVTINTFTNEECGFAYRDSVFKSKKSYKHESVNEDKINNKKINNYNQDKYFILSVTFKLSKIKKLNLEYKDLRDYIKNKEENKNLSSKVEENEKVNFKVKEEKENKNVREEFEENENLNPATNLSLLDVRDMIINIRNSKMPNWRDKESLGTAGSFFKNIIISESEYEKLLNRDFENVPAYRLEIKNENKIEIFYKLSSAYIIDKILNMRDMREGDVGTYKNQALIIVNYYRNENHFTLKTMLGKQNENKEEEGKLSSAAEGGARKEEFVSIKNLEKIGETKREKLEIGGKVFDFSQKIIDECFAKTGLTLEREVNVI